MRSIGIKDLSFDVLSFIDSLHLSIAPESFPPATASPGREDHQLLDGLSRRQSGDVAPTQPLNGSTLSHGGSTHILPTDPAPSLSDRHAQGSLWLEERFT